VPADLLIKSYPGQFGQLLTIILLNSVAHAFPDGKGGTVAINVRASGETALKFCFRTMAAA
jgi:hypothetical protein